MAASAPAFRSIHYLKQFSHCVSPFEPPFFAPLNYVATEIRVTEEVWNHPDAAKIWERSMRQALPM
jgi:hypothetical protein